LPLSCLEIHLFQSIELGGSQYNIYDSRAAIYEKLDRNRDALEDSRKVIELAPSQWQGYARCARLFLKLNRPENAWKMAEFAAERVKEDDTKRRAEIDVLKNQVLEVLEMIQKHKSRHAYHFGNLPLEIAHEIFSLVLEGNPLRVLTLSMVCRQWREVINNTPVFWSTLVLNIRRPAKLAKLWKDRSGGKITSLTMRHPLARGDLDLPQILTGFSWHHLRTLRFSSHLATTIPLTGQLLVNLDELVVFHDMFDLPPILYPNMQARVLDLSNVGVRLADITEHCSQLQSLTITLPSTHLDPATGLLALLSKNPGIHTLYMKLPKAQHLNLHDLPTTELIEMDHLRHVEIESLSHFLTALCSNVSMPALEILRVSTIQSDLFDKFNLLLARNPTLALTELAIKNCSISDGALHALLRASPSLQVLSLTGLSSVTETVEFIAQPEHCPNLKDVDLSGSPNLRSGPVMRLVKGRLGDGDSVQLESLKLNECPLIGSEVLPWLRSKVPLFSCVYMWGKHKPWKR
jgi:F-box/TPR repeat protein Pof3